MHFSKQINYIFFDNLDIEPGTNFFQNESNLQITLINYARK